MSKIETDYILNINPAKKALSLIYGGFRTHFKKVESQSSKTTKKMTSDINKYRVAVSRLGKSLSGGWWARFGQVAAGFTVAYRAINLMEAGLGRSVDLLKEAVVETGELAALQGKLAFWQRMHAQDAMSFSEAYKRAGVNVHALYTESFRSLSTLGDLATGMEEIAQTIGSVPSKMIPELVSVIDFTSLVAQTTGSTTRQIRQELQALTQGEMRTTNILIRSMKNIGVLTDKDIKQLKNMTNQAEIIEKVFKAIHKEWMKLADEIIRSDPTKALDVWSKTARRVYIEGIRAASQVEGVQNIFAEVIRKRTLSMFDEFSDQDWARLTVLMQDLASALDFVLGLFPKFVKGISYLATAAKNLNPEIKKILGYLKDFLIISVILKLATKLYLVFQNLVKPILTLTLAFNGLFLKLIIIPAGITALILELKALYTVITKDWSKGWLFDLKKSFADFHVKQITEAAQKAVKEGRQFQLDDFDMRMLEFQQKANTEKYFGDSGKAANKSFMDSFRDNLQKDSKVVMDSVTTFLSDIEKKYPQVFGYLKDLDLGDVSDGVKKLLDEMGKIDGIDITKFSDLDKALEGLTFNLKDPKGPWDKYLEDMQKNFDAMEYAATQTAKNMESAFGSFFFSVFKGNINSLADIVQSFTDSMLQMLAEVLSKMLVAKIVGNASGSLFSGIFGGGSSAGYTGDASGLGTGQTYASVAHNGGGIGSSSFPKRSVPAGLFNFAPRLHNGLKSDEFPAILQRGETVLKKGDSANPTNVYLTVQAMDAMSFTEFLGRNANSLPGPMNQVFKNNKGIRNTLRKVL